MQPLLDLLTHFNNKNWEEVRFAAHKLASTAGQMHLTGMFTCARATEAAFQVDATQEQISKLPNLIQELTIQGARVFQLVNRGP